MIKQERFVCFLYIEVGRKWLYSSALANEFMSVITVFMVIICLIIVVRGVNKIIVLRLNTPSPEDDYKEVNDPHCPPLKKASIINFSCLRADTHLHTQACTLVHSVPAGEQVAHLYTPTDWSNGTRGPNYILMASIFLLASSREQEQNDVFFILAPVLFFWSWPMLFDHLKF